MASLFLSISFCTISLWILSAVVATPIATATPVKIPPAKPKPLNAVFKLPRAPAKTPALPASAVIAAALAADAAALAARKSFNTVTASATP